MSDDNQITIKRRIVMRSTGFTGDNLYYVYEMEGTGWKPISKGYPHSTSAYAKLGRITSKECDS